MKLKKEDIDFTCQKCGDCCRVDGYVFLKNDEAKAIIDYLEISKADFKKKFTDWFLFLGTVLKLDAEGCCFLIDGRCIIYPVRPLQCKTFPYWNRVLKSQKDWEYITTYCRGAKMAKLNTKKNIVDKKSNIKGDSNE
ncbi:MAG: YkgJ family cysteine cluster protein [bacterium]